MVASLRRGHVEQTWRYLREGPFEQLLGLTHGCCEAGPQSLEAVLRILLGDCWHFSEFAFSGVSANAIPSVANVLSNAIRAVAPWSLEALEQAVESGRIPLHVDGVDARGVLHVMIMRSRSPLPLIPVMHALGRDECVRRLETGARHYYMLNLVG